MAEIKRMSVKDFREEGYLQELNRQFLHPLGLAIEVVVNEDGTERFGSVWDYRDDPEGIVYEFHTMACDKGEHVMQEQSDRRRTRLDQLGFIIQPLPPEENDG